MRLPARRDSGPLPCSGSLLWLGLSKASSAAIDPTDPCGTEWRYGVALSQRSTRYTCRFTSVSRSGSVLVSALIRASDDGTGPPSPKN